MSQAQSEIDRLLAFPAGRASPFAILGLDIAGCEISDVNKAFRKIALLLHPDKCHLPSAGDAFHVAEKAHKLLSNENVLTRLKLADIKQRERQEQEATSSLPPMRSGAPSSSTAAAPIVEAQLPPEPSFGSLSKLAPRGPSDVGQKAAETRRVLGCKDADYFLILDVHPITCTVADIKARYRHMASQLHPDKCGLPHVTDAFKKFVKAYEELSDEKKLPRYRKAYEQQRQSAIRAAELRQRQQSLHTSSPSTGSYAGMTPEERRAQLKRDLLREQQLEAARLADEAVRKRRKTETEQRDAKELSDELERQRKEWKDLQLF